MFPPFFYNIIEMFPVIAPLDLFMIGGEITYHYSISRMAKPPETSFVKVRLWTIPTINTSMSVS